MIDVGINLRCPYVHMAEHLLEAPQIRPSAEQVRGEAMAQRVHRQVPGHARPSGVLLDQSPDFNAT